MRYDGETQYYNNCMDADKIIDARKYKLDISKIDPLVYCARAREYWSVGKKLGDGYNAGKMVARIGT